MERATSRIVLLICLTGLTMGAKAQYTTNVNPKFQFQTLEGWGTSLAWWANGVGGWSDPARSNLVDAVFGSNGLWLNFGRYNIGGGDCPGCNYITVYPDADPGYQPTANGPFVYTADANQQWVAEHAYSTDDMDILEAISYSPPWWMTISGSSTGGVNGAPNLSSSYQGTGANQFPAYLATVAGYFSSNLGLTFRGVDPFNEPDGTWWDYQEAQQEGCAFTTAQEQTVIQNLATELSSLSPLTNVIANDDNSINDVVGDASSYSSTTLSAMTQINTHSYNGTERTQLQSLAATDGKRLVMSEWGSYDTTGHDLSIQLTQDMRQLQPVAWSIWQPNWPELMNINYSNQTYSFNEGYYVFENYTHFIRPGYIFIDIGDNNSLAAYDAHTNKLVIVTMNWASSSVPVTYNLTNFNSMGTSATGYQTSANQNLASIGVVSITGTNPLTFTATLPANSVTTWVIANAVYTPYVTTYNDTASAFTYSSTECGTSWCYTNQQTGAYDNDNHWSATPGAYYTFSFTGTQARVYGSRNNGMGLTGFSVDGGAETDVDLYAPGRTDDLPTYATPNLPYGNHTLTARVTGLKAASAQWPVVSSDRIDVVNSSPISTSAWYQVINNANGLCLSDPGSSTTPGAPLEQLTCVTGQTNQNWQFQSLGNGYYQIANRAVPSLIWDVGGISQANGVGIDLYTSWDGPNQQWLLTQLSNSLWTFASVNSGSCLADPGGSTNNGEQYIQWTCLNDSTQSFQLVQVQ